MNIHNCGSILSVVEMQSSHDISVKIISWKQTTSKSFWVQIVKCLAQIVVRERKRTNTCTASRDKSLHYKLWMPDAVRHLVSGFCFFCCIWDLHTEVLRYAGSLRAVQVLLSETIWGCTMGFVGPDFVSDTDSVFLKHISLLLRGVVLILWACWKYVHVLEQL